MTIAKNNNITNDEPIILKDWLVATGTQYFNLELLPSKNLEFESDIIIDKFTNTTLVPCGCIDEQNNYNRFYPCAIYLGQWHFAVGNDYSTVSGVQLSTKYHVKSVFSENSFNGYVNGSLIYTGNISVSKLNSIELGMFCNRHYENGIEAFKLDESFCGKIGHTTIKANGKTVIDMRPCMTIDGNACMYDSIGHKLYVNQGSGTFTAI